MPWHWHEDFEDESNTLENSEELQYFLWKLEQDLPLEQPPDPWTCITDDQCEPEDIF